MEKKERGKKGKLGKTKKQGNRRIQQKQENLRITGDFKEYRRIQ